MSLPAYQGLSRRSYKAPFKPCRSGKGAARHLQNGQKAPAERVVQLAKIDIDAGIEKDVGINVDIQA